MPTKTAATGMTAEEFYDWANRPENDGRRLELDAGEVVEMPSPGELHGFVCWLTGMLLGNYLFRRGAGYICSNDTGLIVHRRPDTVRGPDLILFLESRAAAEMNRGFCDRVPALIVEVVSPSDKEKDTNRRVRQYLARGVPLVWVVYPEHRLVHVCRPDEFHKVLDETDELTGNGVLPDFACLVRDLFTPPGLAPNTASPKSSPAPKPRPRKGPRK
jgi:Uma2 family endonuclease